MALLVELPVVRQEGLWDHAEQATALDGERAVVDPVAPAQRRADEQQRPQAGRFGDHPGGFFLHGIEQRLLQQQILDRVGRQPEFGEDRQRRTRIVAGLREGEHRVGVARGLGRVAAARAGRHPGEAVAVEGVEGGRSEAPEIGGGGGRRLGHGHLSVGGALKPICGSILGLHTVEDAREASDALYGLLISRARPPAFRVGFPFWLRRISPSPSPLLRPR